MIDLVNPESVGLSSERLKRIDTWLDTQVSSARLAGASVLVGRRGQIAYFAKSGLADVELDKQFAEETILRLYSMSKPVTTVAAMMLYERGCFQLDDAVAKYIPAFSDTKVWDGKTSGDEIGVEDMASPITIKQLMTHTAGLTYGFMHVNPIDAQYRAHKLELPNKERDLESWVNRLATIPLLCQPGTAWNYSVATDVLGRLVEIWSGMRLSEFFKREIFGPLAMDDTGFYVEDHNHPRFAALYSPPRGASLSNSGWSGQGEGSATGLKLVDGSENSPRLKPSHQDSGGGGLTGSIEDYAKFCQMLMNGGELEGIRLLSPKTVEYMRLNHLPDNRDMAAMGQPVWSETSSDGIGFGLGFAVILDPAKANIIASEGEHHWGGAASTFFWLDPEEDLYCVFFTQLIPSSTYPLRRELRTCVYQALVD